MHLKVLEGEKRKKKKENTWRNNGQKFPKFDERYEFTQPRSVATLRTINSKIHTYPHYKQVVKVKDKERNLEEIRKKWLITYKGFSITADFTLKNYKSQKEWDDIFQVLRLSMRILYLEKLSLKNKEEIKKFSDKS